MTTQPIIGRRKRAARQRFRFRHMLMLALAADVMVLGACGAASYEPPGIAVEQTVLPGHVVT